jgi:flagellar biosynthesis protein FliQ
MTEADIINLATAAIELSLKLAGPVLIAAFLMGIVTSILQAVFQLSDQAVAFVPKLLVGGLVLIIAGPWMLQQSLDFFTTLMTSIPTLAR